jgi:fructokinase
MVHLNWSLTNCTIDVKKILCIGEALIDMICTDKGLPLNDGDHFLKKAGGAPMNVAAAIAALGGKVAVSAKVGADPFGQHLIEVLNSFNVDTTEVITDKENFTTFAFVSLMENGERDFYFNRGADRMLSKEDISTINVSDFGIAHFGSATAFLPGPLQDAYVYLLEKAKAENLLISFDPNYRQLLFGENQPEFIKRSWEFIKQSDFFKVSDEEALLITGKSTIDETAQCFFDNTSAVFAITLGKEGTLLGFEKSTTIIPSISIQPVDTTGAGDAFVGAVLYQLSILNSSELKNLNQDNWINIFSKANKAGARTCQYMGAMEAFRHLHKDLLNT